MEVFKLRNGQNMPAIGCGTVNFGREGGKYENPLTDDFSAVTTAVEAGYRLFDTALAYGNEEGIGAAIAASGIRREELFLSSKVPNKEPYNLTVKSVRESVEESLRRMRTDYFDMMLIHHAVPVKVELAGGTMDVECVCMIWDTLIELMREGKLRGIGVSNFNAEQLKKLLDNTTVVPLVDQIRCNPASPNRETIAFCKQHGILPEAHSPLNFTRARGMRYIDPAYMARLEALGEKYGKSWAQILLRYNYQDGLVSIPGSAKLSHQKSNLEIFDFALTDEEMLTLQVNE